MELSNETTIQQNIESNNKIDLSFLTQTIETCIHSSSEFNLSKKAVDDISKKFANSILLDTNNDILTTKLKIRILQAALEIIDKETSKKQIESFEKLNSNSILRNGAEIGIMESGVKWDFTVCNDEKLESLLQEKTVAEDKVKARQEYLKNVKEVIILENQDGGTPKTLNPPKRTSGKSVFVKLK